MREAPWASLLRPQSPVILAHTKSLDRQGISPADLARSFQRYRWVGTRQLTTFEDVVQKGRGNCLTLSAMICSTALALNWSRSQVLICGGGLLSRSLIVAQDSTDSVTVHAWAILALESKGVWIIDPVRMEAEPLGDAGPFEQRMKLAAPVDRIFPMAVGTEGLKVFPDPHHAHEYLEQLWKQ